MSRRSALIAANAGVPVAVVGLVLAPMDGLLIVGIVLAVAGALIAVFSGVTARQRPEGSAATEDLWGRIAAGTGLLILGTLGYLGSPQTVVSVILTIGGVMVISIGVIVHRRARTLTSAPISDPQG